MKMSKQIALLTGVSIAAMVCAVPAAAATTPGPSFINLGQTADFQETLVISNIGYVFFFSVANSGSPPKPHMSSISRTAGSRRSQPGPRRLA